MSNAASVGMPSAYYAARIEFLDYLLKSDLSPKQRREANEEMRVAQVRKLVAEAAERRDMP